MDDYVKIQNRRKFGYYGMEKRDFDDVEGIEEGD
jgi:hypothetical protein